MGPTVPAAHRVNIKIYIKEIVNTTAAARTRSRCKYTFVYFLYNIQIYYYQVPWSRLWFYTIVIRYFSHFLSPLAFFLSLVFFSLFLPASLLLLFFLYPKILMKIVFLYISAVLKPLLDITMRCIVWPLLLLYII